MKAESQDSTQAFSFQAEYSSNIIFPSKLDIIKLNKLVQSDQLETFYSFFFENSSK
jgi:hypothetical protein